jgi:cytochrome P450
MAETMTNATQEMLDGWREHCKRGPESPPLEMTAEMSRLTLGIVGCALVGANVGEEAREFGPALEHTLTYAFRRAGRFFNLPFGFPTPKNLRYMRSIRTLDRVVYSLIDARRPDEDRGDLLSMLMLARDTETGEGMSRKQLRDEVMTILTAGYETSARALAWTFYLMDRHPEEADKLRGELDDVLGGRVPTFEDLPHLAYTGMFIQESMRLYPPVWGLARRAVGDDVIGGHFVPKGSRLIISAYVTQRHPKLWEDPERFDPGRFSPERSKGRHRYAYFPFGGGPRQCIGRNFAMLETTLVLAMVAQAFEPRLLPGHPVDIEPSLTLKPRYGLPMVLREAGC